ncbi:SDR family oxidoreductase [Reinekea marinisedimentorum]|uniref:NAD(P)-dependent dehydrogenase (Short-subunit alcohol dehydrogenase family) n=1 Tax=Reinekea marinisedimentorum TaxID=230495 RepID=A0A4R3HSN0_9GAMM|nr:SDR family oxidoreductase [Reinekea marinisedimentorum]TCS36166.1 NAD(P)-dependent dehydrogenase (short-subunit alcohol dehydrogenase family) [Reinekea marinisedimentorum]
MQHTVITGANRGIGLEFTRYYLSIGHQVTATVRNLDTAQELSALQAENKHLTLRVLDISQSSSIAAFTEQLGNKPIDVLINNAGYYGPKGYSLGNIDVHEWQKVMQINVLGTIELTQALLSNLKRAQSPAKIAFLTSKMGSMGDNNSGGSYIYRSSKAALNACIKSLSIDLAPEILVAALHPGWVQTDMGGANALITAQESVAGLASVIDQLNELTTGQFIDYSGKLIPW